jgi:hypothetical protein
MPTGAELSIFEKPSRVLHLLLASVMPLWTLGYNITICSWRPAGFHQSIFGVQCVAKTVEDNVTAFKTFQIYYFVATFT